MSDRKAHDGAGRGPAGPPPPHGHSAPEEASQGPSGSDFSAIDPELTDDLGAELPLRGDQLDAALEEALAEADSWRDKALRAQADFENTRRRLEARHADALLRAGERIVESLLPVLDDMDRAIDHAVGDGSDVAEGLDAVRRKLLDVLAREGCSAIDPFGATFDPERHNAVQMREDTEVADHTVVEVFQKGYEMHGRVLRPAMVVVSTGGPGRE